VSVDRLWASMMLAADVAAWEGLARGLPVPRDRLSRRVLLALDEEPEGEPVVMDDELALRIELAQTVFAPLVHWRRRAA
jgi:hypothetical protein